MILYRYVYLAKKIRMLFTYLLILIYIFLGKVDVKIGKEGLTFESGPFNYFGLETLKKIPSLTQDRKSMELK